MKNDNAGIGLVAVALLVVGISMASASSSTTHETNPGDVDIGPVATTLREYIDQGSDPVEDEIADALLSWSIALNGN